jgi:hypothetical protein
MTVEHAAARRFRLVSRPAVGVIAVLVPALIAAEWPLAALARLSVNGTGGGAGLLWWFLLPFGAAGFVVAWRKPGHPLGWCLVGLWPRRRCSRPCAAACSDWSTPGSTGPL